MEGSQQDNWKIWISDFQANRVGRSTKNRKLSPLRERIAAGWLLRPHFRGYLGGSHLLFPPSREITLIAFHWESSRKRAKGRKHTKSGFLTFGPTEWPDRRRIKNYPPSGTYCSRLASTTPFSGLFERFDFFGFPHHVRSH